MKNLTFEYCSLSYLNHWLSNDKQWHEALNSNGSVVDKCAAIKKAATFYRVARNLPTECDINATPSIERFRPVLDVLNKISLSEIVNDPVLAIIRTESEISNAYNNVSALSFTTKLLWIKFKQPIIIYDKQARLALGTQEGDLRSFFDRWRKEYIVNEKEIDAACKKLPDLTRYVLNQDIGNRGYIEEICDKPWFKERVFDVYLWNKGNS